MLQKKGGCNEEKIKKIFLVLIYELAICIFVFFNNNVPSKVENLIYNHYNRIRERRD